MKLRPFIKRCFDYSLGDWKKFLFWFDPWCAGQALAYIFLGNNLTELGVKKSVLVRDLWKNGRWAFPIPLNEEVAQVSDFVRYDFVHSKIQALQNFCCKRMI